MKWIYIENDTNSWDQIPTDKTVIVEDEFGWIGQANWNGEDWLLETFNETSKDIVFSRILRFIILED